MNSRVLKFGGSSMVNIPGIKQIIKSPRPTVAVVSAFYGVTDQLVNTMNLAQTGQNKLMKEKIEEIKSFHITKSYQECDSSLKRPIDKIFKDVEKSFEEILDLQTIPNKISDQILSIGEKLSATILASSDVTYKYIDDVIITNDNYSNASPIMNATHHICNLKINDVFNNKKIAIIPGFTARTLEGNITTMGRGGSDLSATIIGSSINAKDIYFYKVELSDGKWEKGLIGIVHPNKETVPELTFNEMAEMAIYGRKVLHKSTMHPIINNDYVSVHIKNTLEPAEAGTIIKKSLSRTKRASPWVTSMIESDKIYLIGEYIVDKIPNDFPYEILDKRVHSITIKFSYHFPSDCKSPSLLYP